MAGPARARAILDELITRARTPGLQYLAVDADRVLFEFNSGLADIGRRVPVDAATTTMAYSMSKTITAVAVLQLVEAGKVGLDDPLDRHVDVNPYGSAITIRQVIAHLSGIPNPIPLRWVHPAGEHAAFDEHAALAAVLRSHPKPAFPPGAKYRYSNIGYWLLGEVVARASGQAFEAYVADRILRPLGIPPADLGYVIPDASHHAGGYLEKYSFFNLVKGLLIDRALVGGAEGPWVRIRSHYPNGPAFGGLVGTARGFARFLQDQVRERSVLLGDAARPLLYEPQRTGGGAPIAMTLGWHIGTLAGSRFYYKEGGGGGFHCLMRVYPVSGAGIATVVMTNATGVDVTGCLDAVDREFVR
jgi:CubicO group peptidase (beta-lactamase class C family)